MSAPKHPEGPLNKPQRDTTATPAENAGATDASAEKAAGADASSASGNDPGQTMPGGTEIPGGSGASLPPGHKPVPLPSWDGVCSVDPDAPVHPDLAGYYAAAMPEQANAHAEGSPEESEERQGQEEAAPEAAISEASLAGTSPVDVETPVADALPSEATSAGYTDATGTPAEKSSGPAEEPAPETHAGTSEGQADDFEESGLVAAHTGEAAVPGAQDADDDEDEDDAEDDDEDAEDEADRPMTLKDHFLELRKRLALIFFCAILGFIVCYPFSQQIFDVLVIPLKAAMPDNSSFVFTAPGEGFFTNLKVAFVAGLFLASPLIFYQVWAFIAPGLYETEKQHLLPVAFFSALFFISGGLFCYYIAFPFAFDFFMAYATGDVKAMLSLSETLSFILQLLLAFGIIFELPLFVFFLARLGLITADWMRSMRRYAVLVNVVVAAILTPPDVMSQMLMAAPLLLLYEISILVAAAFGRKKKREPVEEAADEEAGETDEAAS